MMRKLSVCLLLTVFLAPAAFAGDWYFGAKAGSMLVDIPDSSDPQNGGIFVGWEQGVVLGDLGFEVDLTKSLSDGDVNNSDLSIDTLGVYGVFRTAGPVYFKAKAGYVSEDVSIGALSDDDSGSSIGLGIGFSLKVIQLELEFTTIEEDADYVSLAIKF